MPMVLTQRPTIIVRAATDDDAPRVGWLAYQAGVTLDGLDWSRVAPYWLVAEQEGELVGAVQLCPSLPIAGLEMLSVSHALPHKTKAATVKMLLLMGCATLQRMGAQYVRGVVGPRRQSFIKILLKRGAIHLSDGGVYLMKVRA